MGETGPMGVEGPPVNEIDNVMSSDLILVLIHVLGTAW